jgi:O-antigen/teichoic acid export membrane protein
MLNTSGLLYLSARVVSAAGNLLAVAIFSRLADPAEYGHYVLIFAWSLIFYGFGAQWMRFAFFGVYQSERYGEYAGSLVTLLACGLSVVALVLAALGIYGLFPLSFLLAVFALVVGMTLYEAAFEIARTLLNVRNAALSMILRATLTVLFGSVSLWLGGGARGLAFAIAGANVLAATPALQTLAQLKWSRGSRAAAFHIIAYGWPLLLSFGISAIGQSIDRLLLAHYLGTATLGPYGVASDMLRQSFTVLGESIALSLVTMAKSHANNGDMAATEITLRRAFNGCLATAVFGTAFFVVFGDTVLRLVLHPDFVAPVQDIIPIFAVAFAFMTMRSFYFAQVIYFSKASFLDLMVACLFVVVSATFSAILVPAYGAHGAAVALMLANVVTCFAFMALGRRWYTLPVDMTALFVMPSLGVLFIAGADATAKFLPNGYGALAIDAVAFIICGGFVVRRFGLLRATPAVRMTNAMPIQVSR